MWRAGFTAAPTSGAMVSSSFTSINPLSGGCLRPFRARVIWVDDEEEKGWLPRSLSTMVTNTSWGGAGGGSGGGWERGC